MSLSTLKAIKHKNPRYRRGGFQNKSSHTRGATAGMPLFLQKSSGPATHLQSNKAPPAVVAVINRSRQGGSGLPHQSKRRFESAFGADLSAVRIHNELQHNQVARSLNAKAFTVGSDVFFSHGRYQPGSQKGDRLLAHELTHVLQQSSGGVTAKHVEPGVENGDALSSTTNLAPVCSAISGNVIQRDEEEQQGFDYNLIPPSLAYRNGPFGMSADTSAAQLSYFSDEGRTNLGYQYGGDLFYGANLGGFRSRFGVNPQSGVGSMSFGGSHGGFNYGLRGNTAGSLGLSLGYGSSLLPMPYMLGQQAGAAWQGVGSVLGSAPDFASDPMEAYRANSEAIGAIGQFGGSLGQIYGQQNAGGMPFGAGLSLSYNPEQRWVLGAGVQGSF